VEIRSQQVSTIPSSEGKDDFYEFRMVEFLKIIKKILKEFKQFEKSSALHLLTVAFFNHTPSGQI
jgi:hypothetical protein